MKQANVLGLLEQFDQHGIEVYVDGGWGVDALLGEQTRSHGDLDLAMAREYEGKFGSLMRQLAFIEFERDGNWEANYSLRNDEGDEIDIHVFEFDAEGKNIYGVAYKPEHLTGLGKIGGKTVKTIDPKWMVEFHTWYEPDKDDYHDVKLLCEKYDIPLPAVYEKFKEK